MPNKTNAKSTANEVTMKQALMQLLRMHNDYQIYRKEAGKTYNLATAEEVAKYAKNCLTPQEQKQLLLAYAYQRRILNRFSTYKYTEFIKDKIYGKQPVHPAEQSTEEQAQHLEYLDAQLNWHSYRYQDAKANSIADKAANSND